MSRNDATYVFETLTDKQHATLVLASRHLTSKQIAIELGVAPVTIDKRIEAIRARLDAITRPELLRLYADWSGNYGRIIDEPSILANAGIDQGYSEPQQGEYAFVFEDSLSFDARASWERVPVWLRPGINPSDLGALGKLLAMLGGAVAIMMVAVLSVSFADALTSMIMR
jgi:DNA-binding CsgD family transcriptional regulator